jgi:hypothetical protein
VTIPAAAKATPLAAPVHSVQFVDPETGMLSHHGLTLLSQWREFMVSMNRVIPCSATGTNSITLTPNDSAPLLEKYIDHEIFPFVAANTSTGSVTALVVARSGNLAELKVYITNGATQAGSGDVTAARLYLAVYNSALDSSAGGFVLK